MDDLLKLIVPLSELGLFPKMDALQQVFYEFATGEKVLCILREGEITHWYFTDQPTNRHYVDFSVLPIDASLINSEVNLLETAYWLISFPRPRSVEGNPHEAFLQAWLLAHGAIFVKLVHNIYEVQDT